MSIEAMKQAFDFLYDLWEMRQTVRSDRHKKVMWELDRAIGKAEKRDPMAYAGVRIWIGNQEITQTLTKAQVEHEQVAGMSITNASQMCLDLLKTEMEKNAYGWQSVQNPTEYLDELRGGADLCGND